MPTWDNLDLDLWSVADLRRPGALTRIGGVLDAFEDFKPDHVGSGEPLRRPLESAAVALAETEARLHRNASPQTAFARRRQPKMALGWVGVARPSPTLHPGHEIELSYQTKWFDQPERLERFAAFFKALAEASDAFYGRVFRFTADDQLVPPVFDRELWDVHWLNYWGPGYVERWGLLLDNLGVHQERTANGGVIVWAAATPMEAIDGRPFRTALGRDVFMVGRTRRGEPGELVPTYEAHKRFAPGGELWVRGTPT
jgi:hypothetical protein